MDTAESPASTSSKAPRLAHLRPLDGLRGIAVLTVVLFHFSPEILPGGFLGVDVFFVLSGFLITSLLVTERSATGHTRLRDFWVRRARRLFPALLLLLVAVGLWAVFVSDPREALRLRDDGLSVLGYFANWHFIASNQSYIDQFLGIDPSPLRHAWSLAIEEQFYVVWPLVVAGVGLLIARRARSRHARSTRSFRRVLTILCLVLAAASALAMALLYEEGSDPSRVYYGTDTHAQLILIGAALGALSGGALSLAHRVPRRLLVAAGHAAAVLLALGFVLLDTDTTWLYRGGYFAVALVVAAVIASAGQPGTSPLTWLLSTRALVGLGVISYGVYLWHWPAVVWLTPERTGLDGAGLFLLRSAATLGASILSFFVVEQPIRHGTLRRLNPTVPRVVTPVAIAAVAALLIVPQLGSSEKLAASGGAKGLEKVSSQTFEIAATYENVPRCDSLDAADTTSAEPRRRVVLLGNSIAGEVGTCLRAILQGEGWELQDVTQAGAAMCDMLAYAQGNLNTSPPPDAVIVYALPVALTPCSSDPSQIVPRQIEDVETATRFFLDQGVPLITLVPPVPNAGQGGETPLAPAYREIAAELGDGVHVGDAGTFVRDILGVSQWRMPCLAAGEPGCDGDGGIDVRLVIDGGVHMCTDSSWRGGPCRPEFAGGQRRAAAAIAYSFLTAAAAPSS